MPFPRVLAVDSGAGHAACAVFTTAKSGRLVLEKFIVDAFNPDPTLDDQWPGMIAQSLASMAQREKLSGPASLALPGNHALTKFIKTPSIEKSKRDKIIAFEAQQNIPYDLAEVMWDHVVVDDNGVDMEVLLTAVKTEVVEGLCGAVSSAGMSPTVIQPSCVTLQRAFRYNYPEQTAPVLVVGIGARSTNLLYVEGDRYFARTISLAGNSVTQPIAEALGQDFSAAERLKIQVLAGEVDLPESSPARAAVLAAVTGFVGRLHLEITRSTVNYRRQSGGEAPTKIFLTGGGSMLPELAPSLAEKLKTPVQTLDVLRNVDVKADDAAAHAAILADLVGLAVPLAKGDHPLNLLPASIGDAQAFQRRQPWLIAAAAMVVVALALPGLHYQSVATAAQKQVRVVEQAIRPLQALKSRNAENEEQLAAARREIDALHDLVETKSNWINFFSDLQERLVSVDDVWLEKLEVMRPTTPTDTPPPAAGGLFGGVAPTPDDENAAPPPPPPLRLNVTGRLLDRANPVSRVSQDSYNRVKSLLTSFVDSSYIKAVENERFDANAPGVLRFDFILVVNPEQPL